MALVVRHGELGIYFEGRVVCVWVIKNEKIIDESLDLGLINCWGKRRLGVKGMLCLRQFWILRKRC